MSSNQLYLFKDKRFLPIFIIQFCGCLNDSILKSALIILVTFNLIKEVNTPPYMLVMLANFLFIAPFVIFASLSGEIADRYERAKLVKIIKFIEIGIILLSAYGFYYYNLAILFFALALMGTHSTFFGPIKYSVLPDQLGKDELLSANAYIEAGTFMSIMFGTTIGGLYNFSSKLVIIIATIIAMIGFAASFFMPNSGNTNSKVKINLNIIKESTKIVKYAYSRNRVYLAILGISWFWFIGAAILAQIPGLTKNTLGADENVANLFLVVFSIGVGVGSFLCNKILANKITTKYVFISAIGISVFCIDLYFATSIVELMYSSEHPKTVTEFLSKIHYWRILFDLFCLAAFGGFYVVPLFAVMQYFTSPLYRSRVIAANNLINALFMVGSSAVLSLLFYMKFSITSVILIISILNFVVAFHIYKFVPNTKIFPLKFLQMIFRSVCGLFYKIEVKGIENYKKTGKKTVIIANHLSYIDPVLIATYLPEDIQFAINISVAKKWWVRPFLKLVRTYPIDPNNPMAIKSLIEQVKKNKKIAIFPEGRISTTGSLMKIYEGPAMIADKSDAVILPIRVDGTQFTFFSKIHKIMKASFAFRRKITITILPAKKIKPPEFSNQRERRKHISQALYDIMRDMMFESSNYQETLFQSLINSAKLFGMNKAVLEDIDGNINHYRGIFFKSFILNSIIQKQTKTQERVGVMLPNMANGVIFFFAMQFSGRVPVMIDYTSGKDNIASSCKMCEIKTVYSSLDLVKKLKLEEKIDLIEQQGIKVLYIEELMRKVSYLTKLKSLIASFFPNIYYQYFSPKKDDQLPAVILFSSDGKISDNKKSSKAIVLSHRNIQSNYCQIMSVIDFQPYDLAFNALPLSDGFGLTATIYTFLSGVKLFLYPSPLHHKIIPELIYDIGATIMFGTDDFLNSYASSAHAYDFYSIRYVIAGKEKLKETTRQAWLNKFGIRIFEAYSLTGGASVIATNTPMHYKAGSVGRFLPKIEYFLKSMDNIKDGKKLYVKGPNIMIGYISLENPGKIECTSFEKLGEEEGWYDSCDMVDIDSEGYITILDNQNLKS